MRFKEYLDLLRQPEPDMWPTSSVAQLHSCSKKTTSYASPSCFRLRSLWNWGVSMMATLALC